VYEDGKDLVLRNVIMTSQRSRARETASTERRPLSCEHRFPGERPQISWRGAERDAGSAGGGDLTSYDGICYLKKTEG